ncbi:MAG TPA: NAD(P)/FAD-dependent oxidoreductase [Chloroflexota bacterium]|nr:NAD(P)/FAD-dependent oxidoreductase [Chloroflexota bacterium]
MVLPEVIDLMNNKIDTYDVVVVGGGAAGLSGALLLARSRRSVLVIDRGEPRNAPAAAAHGFLSRDGINPLELLELGRAEVRGYGGQLMEGRVSSVARDDVGFIVTLEDDRVVSARRLLVTTGLVDELPDVPGVRERWGRDVLHCPYCHGWEVRDQAVGILASGSRAVHMALLFRQLTSDLVLFTHTAPPLTDEQAEQLAARHIRVVTGFVDSLEVVDDHLTGVRLRDGSVVPRQALVVAPRFVARSEVLTALGLRPTAHPLGGEFLAVAADATGLTDVPGVWIAGNVTDLAASLVVAAAGGASAAAAINADLVAEDTRLAVTAHRYLPSGAPERVSASVS